MGLNLGVQLVWDWSDQMQMDLAGCSKGRVAHAEQPARDRDIANIGTVDDLWVRRRLRSSGPLGQLKVVPDDNTVAALEPCGSVLSVRAAMARRSQIGPNQLRDSSAFGKSSWTS